MIRLTILALGAAVVLLPSHAQAGPEALSDAELAKFAGGCHSCWDNVWNCGNGRWEVCDGTTTPVPCWYCGSPSTNNKGCEVAWYWGTCETAIFATPSVNCGAKYVDGYCVNSYLGRVCGGAVQEGYCPVFWYVPPADDPCWQ